PEHDHAEAVADEQDRDAGLVENPRAQEVVRGEHGEMPALVLESLDVQHRGHLRPLLRVAATFRVSALLVRRAAAGSSPAFLAISSATRASIRYSSPLSTASRCRFTVSASPRRTGPVSAATAPRLRMPATAPSTSGNRALVASSCFQPICVSSRT